MNVLKRFFFFLGQLVSNIYTHQVGKFLKSSSNYFYSGWVKGAFKTSGANFYIQSPAIVLGGKYISIGDNFSAFSRLRIEAYDHHNESRFTPLLKIGNNVSLNFDCHIACIDKIAIGNGVLIASKVFITDHFHGNSTRESLLLPPNERPLIAKGEVVIGNNVWIGEGVAIMPGVKLGENCIVGANAVVTNSFPANSVIGGVPARLLKTIVF